MEKSQAITNFEINIDEAKTLLNLSSRYSNLSKKNVLLKSSVVIAIAYWERFVEELLFEGSTYISEGLRKPLDLPTIVKQKIALFAVDIDRNSNPEAFSKKVWAFAGAGWSERYRQFSQYLTEKLNTANSEKVKECFYFIFGIKDVFSDWNKNLKDPLKELSLFDGFINKRHEIAHGSDLALIGLEWDYVKSSVDLEIGLALFLERAMWTHILPIVLSSATRYSLMRKYVYDIIKFVTERSRKNISIAQLKKINAAVYGNYKKLAYEPWALLNIASRNEIKPTARLFQFVENKIALPEKIRVLENGIALMEPGCALISYSDLEAHFAR